jgi:glycosyltransferase involved in cell wall biosynthesis
MIGSQGVSMYSLWDSYVHADLITYPSYWEGWGNQFLEAIFARKPIAMFEYPVFLSDIKPKGFSFISLGNTYTIDPDTRFIKADPNIMKHAARKAIEMITDPKRRRESVEQNFRLAAEYFSYEALTRYLLPLIQK